MAIFQRKHNWIMCVLYIGTFGSFIGFSAGFPLLAKSQFPEVNVCSLHLSARCLAHCPARGVDGFRINYGGGRVTFWVFVADDCWCAWSVLLPDDQGSSSWHSMDFSACSLPVYHDRGRECFYFPDDPSIFWQDRKKALKGQPEEDIRKTAERESAAVIGFSSAIGAFGAFFIPKSYGTAISLTGSPDAALTCFRGLLCIVPVFNLAFLHSKKCGNKMLNK
jgi:NNP family nitrate/nitrite transporter-like MFS transporter